MFTSCRALLQSHEEINKRNFLTCYSCLYQSFMAFLVGLLLSMKQLKYLKRSWNSKPLVNTKMFPCLEWEYIFIKKCYCNSCSFISNFMSNWMAWIEQILQKNKAIFLSLIHSLCFTILFFNLQFSMLSRFLVFMLLRFCYQELKNKKLL